MQKQLIENIVRQVLLEYGGVHDDIIQWGNDLYEQILENSNGYARRIASFMPSYNDRPVYYKMFQLHPRIDGVVIHVKVVLFLIFPNEDKNNFQDFLLDHDVLDNYYTHGKNCGELSFVWPADNNVDTAMKGEIIGTINHEFKHAFQSQKTKKQGVSRQYQRAQAEINKGSFGDTNIQQIVNYEVPWIYYRLDRDEIDAWIQEMYAEAKVKQIDIRDSRRYKKLQDTVRDYNLIRYFLKNYPQEKEAILKSISRIDEPQRFFAYCDKRIAYLQQKMKRIVGRWQEEHGQATGSFKQYASNEIKPTSPFNNLSWKQRLRLKDKIRQYLRSFAKKS